MLNVDEGKFNYISTDRCIRRASKAVEALNEALWVELCAFGHGFPTDGESMQKWMDRNNENANMCALACLMEYNSIGLLSCASEYDAVIRALDQPVQWVVIESCGRRAAHTEPFDCTEDANAYIKAQRDAGYTDVNYLIIPSGTV